MTAPAEVTEINRVQFSDVDHEFRALREYITSTGVTFTLVARNTTWHNVLLRVAP